MPTFVAKGPIVPEELVQELEDDRVVLFCGAGISMEAGLPSYVGLVEAVYEQLHAHLPSKRDRVWEWPDRMLGDLEIRSQPGQVRTAVRMLIDKAPISLTYHKALLRLARLNRCSGLRLVTTNFDTYFEQALEQSDTGLRLGIDLHSAPVLPIPRDDRSASWRSVVHLHGRLEPAPSSNDHLVMTSADFGRAYLTDGWAARFVARLFADFSVLFVGYSVNDPVLRYMTDAFAADALVARYRSPRHRAYIFAPHSGKIAPPPNAWRDRGLEPIFYHQARGHQALRQTLVAWAAARDDWLSNTAALVSKFALQAPDMLAPGELSNLLWAILGRRNDQGYGAKVFAELEQVPPIGWLRAIEKHEKDLLTAHREAADRAKLADEPPPASLVSPLQSLITEWFGDPDLTPTAFHLGRWLVRHLDKEGLIDWVAGLTEQGKRLHPHVRRQIRNRLALNSVALRSSVILFWQIVSSEGAWTHAAQRYESSLEISTAFRKSRVTSVAYTEFLSLLRPFLRLSPSAWRMNWADLMDVTDPAEREALEDQFSRVAEAEVDLVGGDLLPSVLKSFDCIPDFDRWLGTTADDLTSLLKAALDLWAIVGEANVSNDPAQYHQPSIRPHEQNRGFHHWTTLIDLLWRSWRYVDSHSMIESRRLVNRWRGMAYQTFHRMALQAIGESPHWTLEEKLEVLLHGLN